MWNNTALVFYPALYSSILIQATSVELVDTGLCSPQDTENPYFPLSINWALPQQSILWWLHCCNGKHGHEFGMSGSLIPANTAMHDISLKTRKRTKKNAFKLQTRTQLCHVKVQCSRWQSHSLKKLPERKKAKKYCKKGIKIESIFLHRHSLTLVTCTSKQLRVTSV